LLYSEAESYICFWNYKFQAIVKIIIKCRLLTDEEKVTTCRFLIEADAVFVNTFTEFGVNGAKAEDAKLMRNTVGDMWLRC